MSLSTQEIAELEGWLSKASVGNMQVEQPVVRPVVFLDVGMDGDGSRLGDAPRLSKRTKKAYAERAARQARKEGGYKKRKLPKGKRHPQKKKKTLRKARLRRWEEQPWKCLVYGFGVWAVTEEEFNEHLAPFWERHVASRLHVQRKWGKGTQAQPYRIWDLKLWYKHTGKPRLLFDGDKLWELEISKPNTLDIEKAPEGAQLFCIGEAALEPLGSSCSALSI